ncbi:MAG: hypothetical protein AAB036_06980, partial [Elusimicrobiota bacterium]
ISGATAEPKAPRISEEDSLDDAASRYRYITQDAPEQMRSLHAVVAGVLDSADQIAKFWGFRFARALLGEKSFEPMVPFLPPLGHLNSEARNAYRAEPALKVYYPSPSGDSEELRGLVDQVLGSLDEYSQTAHEAADQIALGNVLPAELSKRVMDGMLGERGKFMALHRLRAASKRAAIPQWIATLGMIIGSMWKEAFILVPTWPGWTAFAAGAAAFALAVAVSSLAYGDDFERNVRGSSYPVFRRVEVAVSVAPKLQGPDQARLADYFESILRKRWLTHKVEYGTSRTLGTAHISAARGLALLRGHLDARRAKRLAAFLMDHAEKPFLSTELMAPVFAFEILDENQRKRALDLVMKDGPFVLFEDAAVASRFLQLAREGLIPRERRLETLEWLTRILATHRFQERQFTMIAESIAHLAADQSDAARLAAYNAVFDARKSFSSTPPQDEHSVAYYAALLRLGVQKKALTRIADHLLASELNTADQLAWLLSLPELDAQRRAKALAKLGGSAGGPWWSHETWRALDALARHGDLRRERRAQILIDALWKFATEGGHSDRRFEQYAHAAEAMTLLAELNAEPKQP